MSETFLAIDYGTHKTGVAYSTMGIALALGVFPTDDRLVGTITDLVSKKGASSVIVGVSRHMHGWISPHGEKTLEWIKVLREALPPTITTREWDERGTSASARVQFEEDFGYSEKKPLLDGEAARLILEDYLANRPTL